MNIHLISLVHHFISISHRHINRHPQNVINTLTFRPKSEWIRPSCRHETRKPCSQSWENVPKFEGMHQSVLEEAPKKLELPRISPFWKYNRTKETNFVQQPLHYITTPQPPSDSSRSERGNRWSDSREAIDQSEPSDRVNQAIRVSQAIREITYLHLKQNMQLV